MPQPHPIHDRPSAEQAFFKYYPRLLEWAVQLTRYDREAAEDLVHDLYIQFARVQPPLDEVDQIGPYLFAMLRNLYFAQLRRAGRDPINDLSIVEFDSIERGLAAVDRRGLLFVRADLERVCTYACQRKNTSRSASLLILRFFLGYYPSEVMKVAQMSRTAVDKSLEVGRQEARLFMERPNGIRCIVGQGSPPVTSTGGAWSGSAWDGSEDPQALFGQLRQAIFASCEGACFGNAALVRRYRQVPLLGFTMPELAHLASCRACLDQTNRILGLPLLAERSPFDTLDRGTPPGPASSGGAGGIGPSENKVDKGQKTLRRSLNKMEKKAREAFEHRPQNLQIAVNGDIRTSQTVTSELSELHLKLEHAETLGFIEVLSEQDIRLAYLQVADPALQSSLSQAETIKLSDGRSLELTLSFASDPPTIHVIYHDPLMAVDAAEDAAEENTTAPEFDPLPLLPVSFEQPIPFERYDTQPESNSESQPEPTLLALLAKWRVRLTEWFLDGPLGYATVLAALALIGVFFAARNSRPSPEDLLQRATAVENVTLPDQALHRVVEVTELARMGASVSTPVTRQRVDLWSEAGSGKLARRLYDDRGNLLAAEISGAASGTTIYRKGEAIASSAPIRLTDATPETAWRLAPSASDIQEAQAVLPTRETVSAPETYTVDARQPQAGAAGLIEAKLTLRKSDLHATEEILTFHEADRIHRVRLVEAVYERVPLRKVAPGVFMPDHELLPPRTRRHDRSFLTNPLRPATPEMAVRVLYELSQIGADLGGETQITRLPQGRLSVTGTVDTVEKKAELTRALADPKVRSLLQVNVGVNGAPGKPLKRRPARAHLELIEPGADTVPADAAVRKMLAAKGVASSEMDEAVRDFCRQAIQLSLNARMQAWALSSALHLLSPQEVRELSPEGKREWLTIVTRHATALRSALEDLRIALAPLRPTPTDNAVTAAPEINSVEDVTASATQILALVNAQDNAIRSALTLSPQPPTASSQFFEPPEFWNSMDRLRTFSAGVQQTSQTLEAASRSPKAE